MCLHDDARTKRTFFLGQLALLVFFLLQIPARHYPGFHPDLMDGARGCALGVALGLMVLAKWKARRRAA
jgi:hypothetical protein